MVTVEREGLTWSILGVCDIDKKSNININIFQDLYDNDNQTIFSMNKNVF